MPSTHKSLIVILLFLIPLQLHAVCNRVQPGWLWNYEGEIAHKYRIRMTLIFGEQDIAGVYFYASQRKDIPLKGRMLDGNRLVLEEFDSAGIAIARFEAEFPEKDPKSKFGDSSLQCEVIRGIWSKPGGSMIPVFLEQESGNSGSLKSRYGIIGVSNPEKLHHNSQAFWLAVKNDDRKTAAALVRYPIRVDTAAGRKRYTTASELLTDYELIFTPRFREEISKGLPRNMFVRGEGAMLGNGQVWFGSDGRVKALNNYH
jgi:hypothetical protein